MKSAVVNFLVAVMLLLAFGTSCKKKDNSSRGQGLPGSWEQTNGPCNGDIQCLAITGSIFYAGGTRGLASTMNSGKSWTSFLPSSDPLSSVSAIVVRDNTVLAAGDGILRSDDNGQTWARIAKDKLSCCIMSMACDGNIIALGTYNYGPVWISSDNGNTWKETGGNIPGYNVGQVAVLGQNVFYTSEGYGIYVSSDLGFTWSPVNNGLTSLSVTSLISSGQDLLAGTSDGVFRSTDNGLNWSLISNTVLKNKEIICIAQNNSTILVGTYNGLYCSTDNGQNWSTSSNGLTDPRIESVALNGSTYLAGSPSGVYMSADYGQNWAAIGLPDSYVYTLCANGQDVFAAASYMTSGIFFTPDYGSHWTFLYDKMPADHLYAIGWSNTNLLAATDSGVFISPDRGMTWLKRNNGLPNDYITCINADGENFFAGTNQDGLFVSHDEGLNWAHVTTPVPDYQKVMSVYVGGNGVFAGTFAGGILFTADDGLTWSSLNTGLPVTVVTSFVSIGSSLYAGTYTGVYRSDNNGQSWSLEGGSSNVVVYGLAVHGNDLFAATSKNGVLMSVDYGETWVAVNTGLPAGMHSLSIAVNGSWLFVGTDGLGVWRHAL